MTNKDTERLVQQAMQQTIPDKDALWAKIESGLPEQPEFGHIRRSHGKMQVVYRVMGAAACFLLILGGVGVWQAMSGSKNDTMSENAKMAAPQSNYAAPAADKQEIDAACDEAPAENEACQEENEIAQEGAQFKSSAASGNAVREQAAASVNGEADAGESIAADCITLSGTIYGDEGAVQADAALLTEVQAVLDAGYTYMLKELPLTEEARADGILLGFDLNGQEILLAAYEGRYQLIADNKAYVVPETGKALLDNLTMGH